MKNNKLTFLFIFFPIIAFAQNYATCELYDLNKNLLKCEHMEIASNSQAKNFEYACLKLKFPNINSKFSLSRKCEKSHVVYQCEALPFYQKKSKSTYFYYKLHDNTKLKIRCIEATKIWKDFDLSSKDNLLLEGKITTASCLRIDKTKKLLCESRKNLSKEELNKFYYDCQINHSDNRYYQFLKNQDCPGEDVKFTCEDEYGNVNRYYRAYHMYTKQELEVYCQSLRKKWKRPYTGDSDYSQIKWASCSRFENTKLTYCDEMLNDHSPQFRNFIDSCYHDNKKTFFDVNKRCSDKGRKFSCLGGDLAPRNRILYSSDKSKINRLLNLCKFLKLNWRID